MRKFISIDGSKLGQKRKQCQKACEKCRMRKKRCDHVDSQGTPAASMGLRDGPVEHFRNPKRNSVFGSLEEGIANRQSSNENDASNLNEDLVESVTVEGNANTAGVSPQLESGDLERTRQDTAEEAETVMGSRFIGDLNPEGIFLTATSPTVTTGPDQADRIGIWLTERILKNQGNSTNFPEQIESNLFYGFDSMIQKIMIPLIVEECLALLPPRLELGKLCSIYFEKYHPILPIINEHSLQKMDPNSLDIVLLRQGMCLVASSNLSARGYLRLPKTSTLFSPKEFGRKISAAMRTSIELGLVTKKIVIIQALALLSFFIDGPNGGDMSSQLCGRAVHHVHTVGLHIQSQRTGLDAQYAETLLCCVWALDRLNAALHGRPVVMHERDLGRDLDACFRRQNVCFRVFLQVVKLLDKTICLYRPNDDQNVARSVEFPLFEVLLEEFEGSQVPVAKLATIETLYHAIAILSCRTKFPSEPHFSSISYLRQNHSAAQITAIVSHETRNYLSWFPFIPYAISISLGVAYREMRHSKIPMYRSRARSAMLRNCEILQEIEDVSWSAARMAEMGKATLKEMDRVYGEVASSRRWGRGQPHGSSSTEEEVESCAEAGATGLASLPDHETVFPTSDASWDPFMDANVPHDSQGVEPSPALKFPDFDVFALFDPNFDLDGIDALLSGSLDMSMPSAF